METLRSSRTGTCPHLAELSNPASSFQELSAILVGEAEVALSTADRHLATLTVHFGESAVQDLLTRFEDLKAASGDLNDSIANQIISDPALGPIARSMLFLWFAGLLDLAATPFPQATGATFA